MIQVQRMGVNDLPVPARQTEGAAGYDLQFNHPLSDGMTLQPGQRGIFDTGFAWKIPEGFVGLIRPRSGLAVRQGLDVLAGVIDSDFRGTVCVVLINHSAAPVTLSDGERIAQMVIAPCVTVDAELVESLDATDRGEGRFGSTDIGAHKHTHE